MANIYLCQIKIENNSEGSFFDSLYKDPGDLKLATNFPQLVSVIYFVMQCKFLQMHNECNFDL